MTSRRELLQIGLTGSLLFLLAPLGRRSSTGARLSKVIFDERFPASVAFAHELSQHGIPVHAITGDVTALWYHDLYHRWRDGDVHLAGMTTKDSLFCLETLARDAGHCVTHRQTLESGLVSWSIGPGSYRV